VRIARVVRAARRAAVVKDANGDMVGGPSLAMAPGDASRAVSYASQPRSRQRERAPEGPDDPTSGAVRRSIGDQWSRCGRRVGLRRGQRGEAMAGSADRPRTSRRRSPALVAGIAFLAVAAGALAVVQALPTRYAATSVVSFVPR